MLGFLKKALDFYMAIYGTPGTGVVVYSAPDSITDFYRMSGTRLGSPRQAKPKPARRSWVWGGGAVHVGSYRTGGGRVAKPC
jgi:hypothetical protein